jgi:hypothetical protein
LFKWTGARKSENGESEARIGQTTCGEKKKQLIVIRNIKIEELQILF